MTVYDQYRSKRTRIRIRWDNISRYLIAICVSYVVAVLLRGDVVTFVSLIGFSCAFVWLAYVELPRTRR